MRQKDLSIRSNFSVFLPVVALLCLTPGSGFCAGIEAVCDGTIAAWRQDSSMKQYLSEYECTCSNGNSSPPVCRSRSTTAAPAGRSAKKRGPSDEQMVLKELQNYVDSMFKVNVEVYRKYRQMNLQNARKSTNPSKRQYAPRRSANKGLPGRQRNAGISKPWKSILNFWECRWVTPAIVSTSQAPLMRTPEKNSWRNARTFLKRCTL